MRKVLAHYYKICLKRKKGDLGRNRIKGLSDSCGSHHADSRSSKGSVNKFSIYSYYGRHYWTYHHLGMCRRTLAFHAADGNLGEVLQCLEQVFGAHTNTLLLLGLVGGHGDHGSSSSIKRSSGILLRLSKAFHIRKKSTQIYSWQCMKCSCWGEKME